MLAGPSVVRGQGWDLPWLRSGFSTRWGGVSEVYGGRTLNLGWSKEDDPAAVVENRRRFAVEVAGPAAVLVGLRQIHSALVSVIERDGDGKLRAAGNDSQLMGEDGRPMLQGDGLMTDIPGVLLGVGVADCVPVLVADTRRRAVAAFHAGWRGTRARIVEQGIAQMRDRYGSQPSDLIAAIGPSIGPCCYTVGDEVRSEFEGDFSYAAELFSKGSATGQEMQLDLWETNRRQLLYAGVGQGRIWVAKECTACTRVGSERKYFSHRGESGIAGRGLGAIGIVA